MTVLSIVTRPISIFCLLSVFSLLLPVAVQDGQALNWFEHSFAFICLLLSLLLAIIGQSKRTGEVISTLCIVCAALFAGYSVLDVIASAGNNGVNAYGLWLFVIGLGFLAWSAMSMLSDLSHKSKSIKLLVPALFGVWVLYLWQVITTGFDIPSVLLPSPELIGLAIIGNTDILAADFYQTFVKSVLSGYILGCGSGFIVAILVDRIPFLQRGLLPLGSLVSAIPIVGIAPIMVMWFGFDWQSKAAVIVIMTFFPMLVNTLAGLEATSHLEKDLMRSYAASYFQTLLFVRLPNAMPFLFNALKINSTLALIGAIVAEFFGTPIVGMGFRISTEVGRMNVDIVWATIAVAALAGSLSYGILAVLERSVTFWHPSYRRSDR
ncbi:ABC transporter permease [Sneathiella glossodoripedis]|uniref:ABC transporter permease n=1 Tax=Sneathiella glossodoripedis TaxID=418853 RepID=UPI00046E607B|nr:ABC transporter permease [Sneathiella glossodoripedis]